MSAQVITANLLDEGWVVFYSKDNQWHKDINAATVLESNEEAEALLAVASDKDNELRVVGPYLIDVTVDESDVVPVRYREVIRTKGPSVRPDLGYQAD